MEEVTLGPSALRDSIFFRASTPGSVSSHTAFVCITNSTPGGRRLLSSGLTSSLEKDVTSAKILLINPERQEVYESELQET